MRKVWIIITLYLVVDTVLTFYIVEILGLMEGNPIVRSMISMNNGYGIWITFKIIVSSIIWFIFNSNPKLNKTVLIILTGLVIVTLYNLFVIISFI